MRRRGFLAGLFVAPAVITTPGLLMPVSVKAFPVHGPNGLLTLDMIAEHFNRTIQSYREVAAEWNGGKQQSHVDLNWDTRDLTLSMDEFAERYVNPAATMLASKIVAGWGRLALGASMEVPRSLLKSSAMIGGGVVSSSSRNGVDVRAITGYDIGTDRMLLRFDVKHS